VSKYGHNREVDHVFSVWRWLRLNLVLFLLTAIVSLSFPVMSLSRRMADTYFRIRGSQPTSEKVALVLIDDASLTQYGRWPWPRGRVAQLVRAVSQLRPRVIGIDILLVEPEDAANDLALETAIKEAGTVVLPSKISDSLGTGLWTDPLPRFAESAASIGHVQAALDSDGVCRRIPEVEPSVDGPRTAFAIAIANLAGVGQGNKRAEDGDLQSRPARGIEHFGPTYLTINYRQQFAAAETRLPYWTVSARDLLEGNQHKELTGKVVLIGFGATELGDRLFSPVSNQVPMPGVEVNANAVETLLDHTQLEPIGPLFQTFLLLCSSMVSLWLVVRLPGVRGLLCLTALVLGEYLAGYFAFALLQRQFEYGPFLVAGVLAAPLAQLENLLVVDRAITVRLRELQKVLPVPGEILPGKVITQGRKSSPSQLHWKLTSLRRLESELTSLYAFDETLLEAMQEALAVYDSEGHLLFHNSSWKTFCECQDLRPKTGFADITCHIGLSNELVRLSPQAGARLETEVSVKDGLWRFRILRLPWPSADTPKATMLLGEDISARRERDQARAEALGFVTHELRTPLIAIQGFAEFLLRYPQKATESEAPATIFRESRRLVAMINAYLEVLRIDVGARPLRLQPVEINQMVRHVEQVVQPLADSAHIKMDTETVLKSQTMNCDELLVTGALLNLVSNAVKYSPGGSTVRLRVLAGTGFIKFQVYNSGPVIPAEDLERIFEPYHRVSEHSIGKPGWGLGLAFVRRIADQHGGQVQASSSASSGTCFSLILPLLSNIASEAAV
jgi:signal transduction histidine kinase/CHASE2 domain-containing sensor protein